MCAEVGTGRAVLSRRTTLILGNPSMCARFQGGTGLHFRRGRIEITVHPPPPPEAETHESTDQHCIGKREGALFRGGGVKHPGATRQQQNPA